MAIQYHTARFRLVPYLAKALSVLVPALRRRVGLGPPDHEQIGEAEEHEC